LRSAFARAHAARVRRAEGRLIARCLAASLVLAAAAASAAGAACRVAIDIGHTRQRPGATSARGAGEWQFNAALARNVADALSRAGIEPIVLNPAGDAIDLHERPRAARRSGASLLVSIHHDSVQPRYLSRWIWQGREQAYSDAFSGYGLFVSSRNAQPDESRAVAVAIGEALLASGLRPSLHHAEPIAGEGRSLIDARIGLYRYDELVVLAEAPMAAVLIEAGVIVNRDEELRVATPSYEHEVGQAVLAGAAGHCARRAARPRR
jgi:N-acetylmuramoyl-L-alanine amidase